MGTPKKQRQIPYGIIESTAEVGRLVRAKRRQIGMTLVETSALAGVGVRFLSELENGKVTAEIGKVLQVLSRLGLVVKILPRSAGR